MPAIHGLQRKHDGASGYEAHKEMERAKYFYHPQVLLTKYREKPVSQVASFSNWQVPGVNRYIFPLFLP